jgi:hypothetical protein
MDGFRFITLDEWFPDERGGRAKPLGLMIR